MNSNPDDPRNLTDEFKGKSLEEIVETLDKTGIELEIAVENLTRDYNMGTIVRSANAFGVRHVHIIGSRQWNKRGAMMTDKYLHVHYHETPEIFSEEMQCRNRSIIAVDNVKTSIELSKTTLPENAVLVFGAEGPGLSETMLEKADAIIKIEQLGSTRSINVGVAAGIVMYEWVRRYNLM